MEPVIPAVKEPSEYKPPPGIKPGQERGPDGKLRKKAVPQPVLSTVEVPELEAMNRVLATGEDETWQCRNLRELMTEKPETFYRRLYELRGQKPPGASPEAPGQKWDGSGACPCCGRGAEAEEPAEVLIEELLSVVEGRDA